MSALYIRDKTTGKFIPIMTIKGDPGPVGPQGLKGDPGDEGFSPCVWLTPIEGGYRLTVQNKSGENYVDIMNGDPGPIGPQGPQGVQGERGAPFSIAKVYTSVDEMNAGYATDGVEVGCFVLIETGSVDDEDNAKLFVKTDVEYSYLTDLSGAQGIQGPQGIQGIQGIQGPTGEAGYTPQKGVDYFDGVDGEPGEDGYTPQKGVDYFDGKDGINGTGMKRINTHIRNYASAQWQQYGTIDHPEGWAYDPEIYDNSHISVGDTAYIVGTVSDGLDVNGVPVGAAIYGVVTEITDTHIKMTSSYLLMGYAGAAPDTATIVNAVLDALPEWTGGSY